MPTSRAHHRSAGAKCIEASHLGPIGGRLPAVRRRQLLPVLLLVGLGAPGVASAGTFCVKPATGCAAVDTFEQTELQNALDTAASDGEASTIRLGAATYTNTSAVPFSVKDVNNTDPTTVVGAGRGQTVLTTSNAADVLRTDVATGITTIRDLTVRATPGAMHRGIVGPTSGAARGLTLERVDVLNPDQPAGVGADNVVSGATFQWIGGTSVAGASGIGLRLTGGNISLVRDVAIDAGIGVATGFSALPVLLDRLRITARTTGVVITRAATVRDSVVRIDAPAASLSGIDVQSGDSGYTANILNTTLIGPPDGSAAANLRGVGVRAAVNNTDTTQVFLERSIISGFGLSIRREQSNAGGSMSVTTRRSAYDSSPAKVTSGGGGSLVQDALAPSFGFVSDSDPRLRFDSPLIDVGEPPAFVASPGELDLGGDPREVGPAADVGAFEYQRRAPAVAATVPATATGGQVVTLTATGTDPDAGDALTYTWDFGDGTGGAGPSVSHSYAPGQRTWKVVVTDPTGQTATATGTIDVAAAPAPPVVVTPPPVVTPPTTAPRAPRLTRASLSRRRFRATQAGLVLRFTLDRRARVAFVLQRRRGTRFRTVGSLPTTKTLPAGSRRRAFTPRLKGRRLVPGSYRLVLTAIADGKRSTPVRLTFVVRR